jgi:hypothetical protein
MGMTGMKMGRRHMRRRRRRRRRGRAWLASSLPWWKAQVGDRPEVWPQHSPALLAWNPLKAY